jgi:23S rRNA (adenine2503-C2)-methyltransferase
VLILPSSAFAGPEAAGEEEQRRLTLCVSTQVGCPLDCAFCATGTMGFLRNLTSGEIVDQVRQVRRATGKRITNVVFMGMGEPLLNYESTLAATDLLSEGFGIAFRRMTVSTAGWVDGILRLAEERRKVKLAVSLHAATDETRSAIMPVNRRFPLERLMAAIEVYYRATRRRVTYEMIFFDGLNDAEKDVERLITLARRVPSKINVIPFHSIAFTALSGLAASLRPSPRMQKIVARLRDARLTVMVRSSAGEDITAACGQLAVVHDRGDRTKPRSRHHFVPALQEPSQAQP